MPTRWFESLARLASRQVIAVLMVIFPFLTAIFGLLENASIAIQLAAFPRQLTLAAQAGSLFTTLKWTLLIITLVLVLVGWAGLIGSGFRKPAASK